jgi:uncharacterized membrane protein YidH (DUF202 family)
MTNAELMDVGAQAERTALAWQRTAIGVMAVGALWVRWDIHEHLPVWPGILLTAVAGLAVVMLVPVRYSRVLRTVRAGHTPLSRATVPAAAAVLAVVILAVGAEVAIRVIG